MNFSQLKAQNREIEVIQEWHQSGFFSQLTDPKDIRRLALILENQRITGGDPIDEDSAYSQFHRISIAMMRRISERISIVLELVENIPFAFNSYYSRITDIRWAPDTTYCLELMVKSFDALVADLAAEIQALADVSGNFRLYGIYLADDNRIAIEYNYKY